MYIFPIVLFLCVLLSSNVNAQSTLTNSSLDTSANSSNLTNIGATGSNPNSAVNIGPDANAVNTSFKPGAVSTSPNAIIAPGSTNTTLGGPVKIVHVGSATLLPASAVILAQGEVVNIDRAKNQISLRDANGEVGFYSVTDPQVLKGVKEGDQIQIYK